MSGDPQISPLIIPKLACLLKARKELSFVGFLCIIYERPNTGVFDATGYVSAVSYIPKNWGLLFSREQRLHRKAVVRD